MGNFEIAFKHCLGDTISLGEIVDDNSLAEEKTEKLIMINKKKTTIEDFLSSDRYDYFLSFP